MSSDNSDSDDASEVYYCVNCKNEIGHYREWKCVTCNNYFDETCYIYNCLYYGCCEDGNGLRQCKSCVVSKGRKYCLEIDCSCENQHDKNLCVRENNEWKKKTRSEELRKAYECAFGI